MELVTSAANPTVKRFRRLLADRKQRRAQSAFVVEGLQPVWRAVESGWPLELLVVAPELLRQADSIAMVAEREGAGTPVLRIGAELFGRISDRDGPAGLAAIVTGRLDGPQRLPDTDGPVVALHRVGNPGNLGTIVRTADAAGAGGMILLGPCADPFAPAAVKASMGSLFAVPLAACADVEEFFGWCAERRRGTVAATGAAESSLWAARLPDRPVLLFGSEGDGLPAELVERCESAVCIPMVGSVESLNLASAAAVMLYELVRRSV